MLSFATRKMTYYFTSGNKFAINLIYNGSDSITIEITLFVKDDKSNAKEKEVYRIETNDMSEISNRIYTWYKSIYEDMTKYKRDISFATLMIAFYFKNGGHVNVWNIDKTYKTRIALFPSGNIVISSKEVMVCGHF